MREHWAGLTSSKDHWKPIWLGWDSGVLNFSQAFQNSLKSSLRVYLADCVLRAKLKKMA